MSYNPGEYDWDSQVPTAGPSTSRNTRAKSNARDKSMTPRDSWDQMDVDDEPQSRALNQTLRAERVPGIVPQVSSVIVSVRL
jgi:hypothetical protein